MALLDQKLIEMVEDLTGGPAPIPGVLDEGAWSALLGKRGAGIGWSQFNELLLLLGYHRVTQQFFRFLADGTLEPQPRASIGSVEEFESGIQRVRQMSLLFFGNVKFGFQVLSREPDTLALRFAAMVPRELKTYMTRYEPVKSIELIPGEDTYFLGYIVRGELKEKLAADPTNATLLQQENRRVQVVEIGKRNHQAYLASDHLDVYVATSMRARHEYIEVSRFCDSVFQHSKLNKLKLRWFDPTQAYCVDRVDKGLAEALMLKRAKCTLYLVQETDTLGKDSELASTLAQGKPVIAYVPKADAAFVTDRLKTLREISPDKTEEELILSQLQMYDPSLAWSDPDVRAWSGKAAKVDIPAAKERLVAVVKKHYDKRARTLKEDHPLGIQVHLETGVANGVLVARSIDDCAELIRRVITRSLEFLIKTTENGTYLVENVSDSIYRVTTSDPMLTNAFWNFYLSPSE